MVRKRIVIVAAAMFLAYLVGYFALRDRHFLVHSAVRSHQYTYLEHSIRGGDMGIVGSRMGYYAAIFYTPLRAAERSYWYRQNPVGTPLSSADRNRLPE
ncbi:MAG: hypothetical protein EOP84_23830 [Verrucomicrobiaceae bacterium]|nr:MAG: hypothetical protein EOP84_23830 [Verrucomicrobiaceae bacterium]